MEGALYILKVLQDFLVISIQLGILMTLWNKFSLGEKNSFIKNLLIIIVAAMVYSITGLYYENNYIFYFISVIFLVKFIYNQSLIKTSLEFVVFICVNIIFEMLILIFMKLMGITYFNNFTFNLSCTLTEVILIMFICKFVLNKERLYDFKLHSGIAIYFIVNLAFCIGVCKLVWKYEENLIMDNLYIVVIGLLIIVGVNLYLYNYISKVSEKKKILEVQNKYNNILKDMMNDVRRQQHELKNYINTINGIIDVSSIDTVKDKLKNYIGHSRNLNKDIEDIVYIDNTIIKAIIYNKLCEAEKMNINFTFNINNSLLEDKINDYEISDILSNLLNNAFEEVSKGDKSDKNVSINIFAEKNKSIIEVRNICKNIQTNTINNIFKLGFSTKKDKNRGYGLYNVKKIVERNNGSIKVYLEDNYIVFRIEFNN